jgi:hypothetical protein
MGVLVLVEVGKEGSSLIRACFAHHRDWQAGKQEEIETHR